MPDVPVSLDVVRGTVTVPPDHPTPAVATIRRPSNRASVWSRLHETVANRVRPFPTLRAVTGSIALTWEVAVVTFPRAVARPVRAVRRTCGVGRPRGPAPPGRVVPAADAWTGVMPGEEVLVADRVPGP